MKTRIPKSTAPARREAVKALAARLAEAERQAAAAKSATIAAKAKAKETRKVYKQAKRIAKTARKAVKALKKELRTLKEHVRLARVRRAKRKFPVARVKRSAPSEPIAPTVPLSVDVAPPLAPETPRNISGIEAADSNANTIKSGPADESAR
jgi:chromosome segregation ATPase